jgi:hypothetical protein
VGTAANHLQGNSESSTLLSASSCLVTAMDH